MKPPEVDRAEALRRAIAARKARAAIKAAVSAGETSPLQVAMNAWHDRESAESSLRVRDLLLSIPGLGPVKVEQILAQLSIASSKRLGGLGRRQKAQFQEWASNLVAPVLNQDRPTTRGQLVVLAGPTAVGKGAVSSYIRDNYPNVLLSVSATTRKPRPGEVDGVSYRFVTDNEFDELEKSGQMLETAIVHNAYRYGTPRKPIEDALAAGKSVLLEIDLQGARAVKKAVSDAVLIFLLPPSWEELVRRLTGRGTEDASEQARRLETAKMELAAQGEFDYRVVNDDVARAASEVVQLMGLSSRIRRK
ncbi:MAG: guanylate kinase [Microbacteriaceae bacterium]|nr:guanylate kinase [Cryobacterium sp.]MCC6376759.1 guanylate kinase [Microbacteriaceae bacterium]